MITKMAERTGFEPVEERLAPHRFANRIRPLISPTLLSRNR